jgi:ribosomal protein L37AE/L43A
MIDAHLHIFKDNNLQIDQISEKKLLKSRSRLKNLIQISIWYWIENGLDKKEAKIRVTDEICNQYKIPKNKFSVNLFDSTLCDDISKFLTSLNRRKTPKCPYCFQDSIFLEEKSIYRCEPCDAQVGTHKGTQKPLGTLANSELRKARQQAHAFFERMWKNQAVSHNEKKSYYRNNAYRWLAKEMNVESCHIGMFDLDNCKKVIELCSKQMKSKKPFF